MEFSGVLNLKMEWQVQVDHRQQDYTDRMLGRRLGLGLANK